MAECGSTPRADATRAGSDRSGIGPMISVLQ
jgi:hypothetical protein